MAETIEMRGQRALDSEASPVLQRLGGAHHVIVEAGHSHHEGCRELVTSGGPAAGRVVTLEDTHELSRLVYRTGSVLPQSHWAAYLL